MRYLTIRREKSFVGCLSKSHVYIEDPYYGDTTIGGVRCRKLGDLKNGSEATFIIGDEALRVYVIVDKLTKNFCNDFFIVPPGNFNVLLVGKNDITPYGNVFRFYGNDHPEALANRERGTRTGIAILIAVIVLSFVGGFIVGVIGALNEEPQPKTFSAGDISIVLTDDFDKADWEGFDAVWESWDVAVVVLEEPFETLAELTANPAAATVQDYAEMCCEANERMVEIQTQDGLTYCFYDWTDEEEGETYCYYTYFYKSADSFWMVQFIMYAEDVDAYEEIIPQWAQSVTFARPSTDGYDGYL